jgi:hypothetical protein
VGHGNLPAWAQAQPDAFWTAADTYERANGRLYTALDVALPRELARPAQLALAQAFVARVVSATLPYAWAVRVRQALDGREQAYLLLMLSERTLDGLARDPAHFFTRADPRHPARGGAAKDPDWNRRDTVRALRVLWETTANEALAHAGLAIRIDHRRLAAQGIDRAPEPKLGATRTAWLRRGRVTPPAAEVQTLRQARAALAQVAQALAEAQGQAGELGSAACG